jgi:hypothetical protein
MEVGRALGAHAVANQHRFDLVVPGQADSTGWASEELAWQALPRYSTDPIFALSVVQLWHGSVNASRSKSGTWGVSFIDDDTIASEVGDTLPVAICRARITVPYRTLGEN